MRKLTQRVIARSKWKAKQRLAGDSRFYGDGGTIHHTGHLDVETFRGTVVAVWFRCQPLPFQQHEVEGLRATEMERMNGLPEDPFHGSVLTGVEVRDRQP